MTQTLPRETLERVIGCWFDEPVQWTPLYGDVDLNIRVESVSGRRTVLKIAAGDPGDARPLIEFQQALLDALEGGSGPVRCARVVRTLDGEGVATCVVGDSERAAWMLTYLEGELLDRVPAYSPDLLADIGEAVARVDRAIGSVDHPMAHRPLRWDLARVMALRDLASHVTRPERRDLLECAFDRVGDRLVSALAARPVAVIHNDGGNQHNMLVRREGADWRICGLIDFGDAVATHRICGLGIAAAYALFGAESAEQALSEVARGYHRFLPLDPEDVALLPELVLARLCMSLAISSERLAQCPDDAYLQVSARPAWRWLRRLLRTDPDGLIECVQRAIDGG